VSDMVHMAVMAAHEAVES